MAKVCNFYKTSVIRQKRESQNGYFKKTRHAKFSEKRTFLRTDTHTYDDLEVQKIVLCFVETPVLRLALLPYYRRKDPLQGWFPNFAFNIKRIQAN